MYTIQNNRLAWHYQNIIYFILDILCACIVSLFVYEINSDQTTVNTLLVWLVTLSFFWYVSAPPIRFFNQSYRHPVRLVGSVGIVALVYFFVLRANYSIVSLCLVSCGWVFGALVIRLVLSLIRPAQRIVGHPLVLEKLEYNSKLKKIICQDPTKINLDHFDCVVFDPKFNYSEKWQEFFVHVSTVGIPVFSLSELHELAYGKVPVELLQEFWIEHSFVLNRFYLKLKRFIDVLVTVILLPILLPIAFIVAILIQLCMGGQIVFKQQRVGLAGEIFTIYKFRTMFDKQVLNVHYQDNVSGDDPRITKLGRILRLFRLDEIPQFYNILLGDMSLIGPRPEWLQNASQFAKEIPLYKLRHIVRPGLTGWAQVEQGHIVGTSGNYEKLRFDIYYVKHCSIWLDLKIIMKTIKILLSGRGV
jgi:lipopolysaccharide/colanic/teichoic acid biosynthesis glycosyltransferase